MLRVATSERRVRRPPSDGSRRTLWSLDGHPSTKVLDEPFTAALRFEVLMDVLGEDDHNALAAFNLLGGSAGDKVRCLYHGSDSYSVILTVLIVPSSR